MDEQDRSGADGQPRPPLPDQPRIVGPQRDEHFGKFWEALDERVAWAAGEPPVWARRPEWQRPGGEPYAIDGQPNWIRSFLDGLQPEVRAWLERHGPRVADEPPAREGADVFVSGLPDGPWEHVGHVADGEALRFDWPSADEAAAQRRDDERERPLLHREALRAVLRDWEGSQRDRARFVLAPDGRVSFEHPWPYGVGPYDAPKRHGEAVRPPCNGCGETVVWSELDWQGGRDGVRDAWHRRCRREAEQAAVREAAGELASAAGVAGRAVGSLVRGRLKDVRHRSVCTPVDEERAARRYRRWRGLVHAVRVEADRAVGVVVGSPLHVGACAARRLELAVFEARNLAHAARYAGEAFVRGRGAGPRLPWGGSLHHFGDAEERG